MVDEPIQDEATACALLDEFAPRLAGPAHLCLGVAEDASHAEITAAFAEVGDRLHPRRFGALSTVTRNRAIAAYEQVSGAFAKLVYGEDLEGDGSDDDMITRRVRRGVGADERLRRR